MKSSKVRYQELDILRGLAVILVIGRHILYIPEDLSQLTKIVLLTWKQMGWIGVDLFFVLSGFLVSGLLFREHQETGEIRVVRFLIRRGFKIYPSFYTFILVTHLSSFVIQLAPNNSYIGYIGEVFFLQNYVGSLWYHTWTLAVEEHFYLILVFILSIASRRVPKRENNFNIMFKVIFLIAITLLILRIVMAFFNPNVNWWKVLPYTHLRIDSLFFGVLISLFFYYYKIQLKIIISKYKLTLIFFIALAFIIPALVPLTSRFMYSIGFTINYLGFGSLLIISILNNNAMKEKLIEYLSPMSLVGRFSYSIYLWHMLTYNLIAKVISPQNSIFEFYLHTFMYILGSIVIGVITAKLVEFPFLKLRDSWFN